MIKRNLLTSILLYESVRTTKSRAKAVQPMVDRLVSTAKKRPPHVAIRFINRYVTDKNASRKIMEVFIERYKDRNSGLTRIVPAGVRQGDGAQLVDFSLVDFDPDAAKPKTEAKEAKESKEAKKSKASPASSASSASSKKTEKTEKKATTKKATKTTTAKKK